MRQDRGYRIQDISAIINREWGIRRRALSIFLLILVAFFAVCLTQYVFAGVKNTKHDLSVNSTGATIKAKSSTGVTEICVFCHTPHGAINPAGLGAPIWNHTLSTANYTVPNNLMTAYADLLSAVGQPDKGSRLCLACHDGTIAIGSIANTPGPGSTGSISMVQNLSDITYMPGTANLGTDISGMHPVSIAVNDDLITDRSCDYTGGVDYLQYPSNPVTLRPTSATYKGNTGKNGKGVQCRSCHDPHNNNPSWGVFLVTSYSQLCIACHPGCP